MQILSCKHQRRTPRCWKGWLGGDKPFCNPFPKSLASGIDRRTSSAMSLTPGKMVDLDNRTHVATISLHVIVVVVVNVKSVCRCSIGTCTLVLKIHCIRIDSLSLLALPFSSRLDEVGCTVESLITSSRPDNREVAVVAGRFVRLNCSYEFEFACWRMVGVGALLLCSATVAVVVARHLNRQ